MNINNIAESHDYFADRNVDLTSISQKVSQLINIQSEPLILPKQWYEPFFMKVLNDFREHHNIPDTIPLPSGNMKPHKLLSYILDVMAHSMGEEKRNSILKELEEYKSGLPTDLN